MRPVNRCSVTTNSDAVALRAPHLATGAVVAAQGTQFAKAVYSMFQGFNALFFGGELAPPLVLITQAGSARTLGDYIGRDLHGLESRIRIAPAAAKRGLRFTFDVLLHEMVHAWQHEIDHHSEPGYRGHGPRFASKCNEIGVQLALPAVGVKGRDGLPDCAHWPLNVRSAGYYPTAYVAPTRRAPSLTREDGNPTSDSQPGLRASGVVERFASLVRELGVQDLEELAAIMAAELTRRASQGAPNEDRDS